MRSPCDSHSLTLVSTFVGAVRRESGVELAYDAADEAFRAELRAWLEDNLPDEIRTRGIILGDHGGGGDTYPEWARQWQATLFEAGWLVPGWPPEFGGRNATPLQTLIYHEELGRLHCLRTLNFQGLNIAAPSLRDFGTPEQIDRWLVPTLRADVLWCIGMSEPGAGSDLGGLSTRATLEGDKFIVNGQKVWTSSAHHADWCFLYCRTDPDAPKHAGISVLVVDMRNTPGITVRPFPHLTGHVDFAEVFFTDAPVPKENLIGKLHDGWRVTMGSLAHERGGLWLQGVSSLEATVATLIELARKTGKIEDAGVREKLAWAHEQVTTLRALGYKGFASFDEQGAPEHSLLKLAAAELQKTLAEFGTVMPGPFGPVVDGSAAGADGHWPTYFFTSFASTIAGGTSEIQRNIIAERILGLPRAGAKKK
jgi:alkylation response protein AidB-like acyl-CoA dehydrogenase